MRMSLVPLSQTITVSAPSRLHFGLLSIGELTQRKYGGAGLMIDAPRTDVIVTPAEQLKIDAAEDANESTMVAIGLWQKAFAPGAVRDIPVENLPVQLTVKNALRHRGFGSGTQLAFAITTALQLAFDQPLPSAEEMAMALGRGKRSAIGSYGFFEGGFLVDRGVANEPIAPLDMRTDFPDQWKIALIQPIVDEATPVFGDAELAAFRDLPGTTQTKADKLAALLKNDILPAVLNADFPTFADAVTEYGYQSGMYYSDVVGGAYASRAGTAIVDEIRRLGQFAVGQSSWGPTIFAIGPSEKEVNWLVEKLGEGVQDVACQIEVVSADSRGMRIHRVPL